MITVDFFFQMKTPPFFFKIEQTQFTNESRNFCGPICTESLLA